jgi:hypothetical protein
MNTKDILGEQVLKSIKQIRLCKNGKELAKAKAEFEEIFERYCSFHRTAILDGAKWVRIEDFRNGLYTCFDSHGGEYKAKESQLDWN